MPAWCGCWTPEQGYRFQRFQIAAPIIPARMPRRSPPYIQSMGTA